MEHNFSYPDDCLHPDCVRRRDKMITEEIEEWNREHPTLPPKPSPFQLARWLEERPSLVAWLREKAAYHSGTREAWLLRLADELEARDDN